MKVITSLLIVAVMGFLVTLTRCIFWGAPWLADLVCGYLIVVLGIMAINLWTVKGDKNG